MKGDIELNDFIEQCTRIAQHTSPQGTTEIVQTVEQPPERTHWKALGLYYAILSNSADSFIDMYSSVYSVDEFTEVCALIKESTKEQGVKTLQTLLQTLKKRKQRAKA